MMSSLPFAFSIMYICVGFGVITWMILEGALFDTSSISHIYTNHTDPHFFWIASGEMPIAMLDVYLALKVYFLRQGSRRSQVILGKLIGIIAVGVAMKIATVILFLTGNDPYWFFYLVVFPMSALLYEITNSLWVTLAKSSLNLCDKPLNLDEDFESV